MFPQSRFATLLFQPSIETHDLFTRRLQTANGDPRNAPVAWALDGAYTSMESLSIFQTLSMRIAVANNLAFIYGRLSPPLHHRLYVFLANDSTSMAELPDQTEPNFCGTSIPTGRVYGLAAAYLGSTKYAIVVQRAKATYLEIFDIPADSSSVTSTQFVNRVHLFGLNAVGSSPVSLVGAEVVQNINSSHLLMSGVSLAAQRGSPLIAFTDSVGEPSTMSLSQPPTDLECLPDAKPLAAEYSADRSVGIILYAGPNGNLHTYFTMQWFNMSAAVAVSDVSTPYALSDQDVVGLNGRLPAYFTSKTEIAFIAKRAPTDYRLITRSGAGVPTITLGSTAMPVNSTSGGFTFALSKTAPILMYVCGTRSYCATTVNRVSINDGLPNQSTVFVTPSA
jgi:hypothetical protein